MKIFPYQKLAQQKNSLLPVYTVDVYDYFVSNIIGLLWSEEIVGIKNAMHRAHILADAGKSVSVMDGSYTVARFIQDADTKFIWYPINKPLRGTPILSKVVVEVLRQYYN